MSTSSAAKSVSNWSGVTSMLPLISAVLADSYWDRYSTITGSSVIYIVGFFGLSLWAVVLCAWMPESSLFVPLYLISIGQSGYNPSLQVFGTDQLEMEDDQPCCKEKSMFFQWWYFGICSGSLLGNSVTSYVQDNFGWGIGFAIPTIAMSLSVVCFFCCNRFYVRKTQINANRGSSSIVQSVKNFVENITSRTFDSLPVEADAAELELQEKPLNGDFDRYKIPDTNFIEADELPPGVCKVIWRLLPIWLTLLMFAVIFQQPSTFFTKQGISMKHAFGHAFVIPPAMLQSVTTISIVSIMPMYDKVVIPISRLINRNGGGIDVLQRMGIGMLLSVLAMVVAALVEKRRLTVAVNRQMSIFWLIPQYVLLGVSDVFTVVGMQEFFYAQMPSTMRTTGFGLYQSVFGVGSILGAILITVVESFSVTSGGGHGWFDDDMSEARLDKYYWFLALLSFVSFLLFVYLCKYYNGKDSNNVNKN